MVWTHVSETKFSASILRDRLESMLAWEILLPTCSDETDIGMSVCRARANKYTESARRSALHARLCSSNSNFDMNDHYQPCNMWWRGMETYSTVWWGELWNMKIVTPIIHLAYACPWFWSSPITREKSWHFWLDFAKLETLLHCFKLSNLFGLNISASQTIPGQSGEHQEDMWSCLREANPVEQGIFK